MAVNWSPVLIATFPLLGWMATEINTGVATVTSVEPVVLLSVAEMVDVPTPKAESRPVADTPATVMPVEDQVVTRLMFCVEPSLKVPVATNCRNTPSGIVLSAGVTAIESKATFVTVRLDDAEMLSSDALITVLPGADPATASPLLLTLAIVGAEELQVTRLETFCVLPFVKLPMAVNC